MPDYPLRLFSGSANRPLANEMAAILKQDLGNCTTTHLADSEIHVQIHELVRGDDVFLIQPLCAGQRQPDGLLFTSAFRGPRYTASPWWCPIFLWPLRNAWPWPRGDQRAWHDRNVGASRLIYVISPRRPRGFDIPVDPLSAHGAGGALRNDPKFRDRWWFRPDRTKPASRFALRRCACRWCLISASVRFPDFESGCT